MPAVDTSLPWIQITNPLAQPPGTLLLELSVALCWILTLVHVAKAYARGESRPLFAWISILVYGVILEIITYHYLDNFTHEHFTVMLYHHRLPLYICMVYQVVIYVCQQAAERLRVSPVIEATAAGFLVMIMYTSYDVLGPVMPWWRWNPHFVTEARWLGVPYTSTLWVFLYHAALVYLVRRMDPVRLRWLDGTAVGAGWWGRVIGAATVVGVGTLFLGFLVFLPYHVLRLVGLPDAWILLLFGGIGAVTVLRAIGGVVPRTDPSLVAIGVIWHGFFLVSALSWSGEGTTDPVGMIRGIAIGLALASGGLQLWIQRGPCRRVSAP